MPIARKLAVTIGIGNQQGTQFHEIEAVVDPGSTFTTAPRTLLQDLGVPVARRVPVRLVSGRVARVDLGWTTVRLEGQAFPTQVIFAGEDEPGLLGDVTLAEALLAVDPVARRLLPVDADRL